MSVEAGSDWSHNLSRCDRRFFAAAGKTLTFIAWLVELTIKPSSRDALTCPSLAMEKH